MGYLWLASFAPPPREPLEFVLGRGEGRPVREIKSARRHVPGASCGLRAWPCAWPKVTPKDASQGSSPAVFPGRILDAVRAHAPGAEHRGTRAVGTKQEEHVRIAGIQGVAGRQPRRVGKATVPERLVGPCSLEH